MGEGAHRPRGVIIRARQSLLLLVLLTLPWPIKPASAADDLVWGRKKSEWLAIVNRASRATADGRLERDVEYRVALHAAVHLAAKDKEARRLLLRLLGELEQGVSRAEQKESAALGIGSAMRQEVMNLLAGLASSLTPDLLKVLAGKNQLVRLRALEVLANGGDTSEPVIAALQTARTDKTQGFTGSAGALTALWQRGHDIPGQVEIWG